ncbi:MAG TPA: hypothetical protein VFB31_12230 [Pseudolabrys sp.]|nr:hypothetical protein [Pseudolabrys sp.]
MNKTPDKPDNVVNIPVKHRGPAHDDIPATLSPARAADDPRTREAMRLVEAFLAIEDESARRALITLAERLVSYDWLRQTQQR